MKTQRFEHAVEIGAVTVPGVTLVADLNRKR